MRQAQHSLSLRPQGQGLYEVTNQIAAWLVEQSVREGLLTVFIRHTSASLLIQENVDPDVQRDLETFFKKLVPEELHLYRHTAEGPDDIPAHARGCLPNPHTQVWKARCASVSRCGVGAAATNVRFFGFSSAVPSGTDSQDGGVDGP